MVVRKSEEKGPLGKLGIDLGIILKWMLTNVG
jgi:hypothetical protein